MKVYHYIFRYSFFDKKKSEVGYGTYPYNLLTPYHKLSPDVKEQIEREIAFAKKHEKVSISCFSLLDDESISN